MLGRRTRPRSPRHVKAVPTNAQLKIGRALELFNASEHPRTVAGIARTLGTPHASASTSKSSAAEVLLTVAWELSWYQFGVDLSDGREPVRPRNQGQELSELPPEAQDWNCTVDATAASSSERVRGGGRWQSRPSGGRRRSKRWRAAGTARIVMWAPKAMGPGRSDRSPGEL